MFALLMHPGRPRVNRSPLTVPPDLFRHTDPALQREWRGDHALIVSSGDPSSRAEPRLATCRETGLVAVMWGAIHNRADIAAGLGLAAGASSVETALAAYRAHGADAGERLVGEFAIAVHDPRDGSITAWRDPLGIRPLYFAQADGELALATSIPPLQRLSGRHGDIDAQWLARFIGGISMSREATPFSSIAKVPPGHRLRFDRDGVQMHRYHRFDPEAARADRRDPAILAAYRDTLEEAVRCRLQCADGIGVETSGGLDSSTIVGFAPVMVSDADNRLHGFGFIGSEKEPDAILGVSRHAGLANNHLFIRKLDVAAMERRAFDVLGHPAEHANSVGHLPFYQLARRLDVHSLLSGFGGDEGVTNYANNHRRDLLVTGQRKAMWQLLKGNPAARALRMAKALLRHGRYPEFAPNMLKGAESRTGAHLLTDEAAEAVALEAEYRDGARWYHEYDTLNQFAIGMLEKPFVSTRTESGSLIAASFGIEYHWPLLDSRLIACWLAAPTIEKASKDMGRYLHRRAVAGVVPDNVRLQVSKYMGPPLGGQDMPRQDKEKPMWERLVSDLHPALQGMVDRNRLVRAIEACNEAGAAGGEGRRLQMEARFLRSLQTADNWLRDNDSKTAQKGAGA